MAPNRKAKQRVLDSTTYQKRRKLQLEDVTAQDCVICLEKVTCRGALGVCDHWFCFICIYEWSKSTNTCPLCKSRFRCITKVSQERHGSPHRNIRIKDKDQTIINYHDDDFEVAMGFIVESEDVEDEAVNDETFIPTGSPEIIIPGSSRHERISSLRPLRMGSEIVPLRRSARHQMNISYSQGSSDVNSMLTEEQNEMNNEELSEEVESLQSDNTETEENPRIEQTAKNTARKRKRRARICYQSPQSRRRSKSRSSAPPKTSGGWINMDYKRRSTTARRRSENGGLSTSSSTLVSPESASSHSLRSCTTPCTPNADEVISSNEHLSSCSTGSYYKQKLQRTAKTVGQKKLRQINLDLTPEPSYTPRERRSNATIKINVLRRTTVTNSEDGGKEKENHASKSSRYVINDFLNYDSEETLFEKNVEGTNSSEDDGDISIIRSNARHTNIKTSLDSGESSKHHHENFESDLTASFLSQEHPMEEEVFEFQKDTGSLNELLNNLEYIDDDTSPCILSQRSSIATSESLKMCVKAEQSKIDTDSSKSSIRSSTAIRKQLNQEGAVPSRCCGVSSSSVSPIDKSTEKSRESSVTNADVMRRNMRIAPKRFTYASLTRKFGKSVINDETQVRPPLRDVPNMNVVMQTTPDKYKYKRRWKH